MKIYLAGAHGDYFCKLTLKYKLRKLYSILNEKRLINDYFKQYNKELMIDSGAHTWNKEKLTFLGGVKKKVKKDLKQHIIDYENYINENKDKNCIFVELDVYGTLDKKIIDDMWIKLKKIKGLKCKLIRVYHPIIDNYTLKELKKWIKEGQTYIGIGNDSIRLIDKIFNITRDKIKIHGFAMTKIPLMEKYPFYSVDSTSVLSTVMYGGSYEGLRYIGKDKLIKEKNIDIMYENYDRLEKAAMQTKKLEKYITNLWEEKGVIWND